MRCQTRECEALATHVRDIPTIGESICFCEKHVNEEIEKYSKDFGWCVMTPERLKEEEDAEKALYDAIRTGRMALSNFWAGKK